MTRTSPILLATILTAWLAGCATDGEQRADDTKAKTARNHEEKFAELDLDNNGKLSATELQSAPAPGPMLAAHLADIDADHDGELTHDEIRAAMQKHHGAGDGDHAKRFAELDTDKNGKLSRAELEAAPPPGKLLAAHFAEIDSNGDGGLTHDEIAVAMQARHGEGSH